MNVKCENKSRRLRVGTDSVKTSTPKVLQTFSLQRAKSNVVICRGKSNSFLTSRLNNPISANVKPESGTVG